MDLNKRLLKMTASIVIKIYTCPQLYIIVSNICSLSDNISILYSS